MTDHKASDAGPVMVNGRFTDNLPVDDRGLAYGDGLFETMRCVRGDIPLWAYHRARLVAGCERLTIPLPNAELDVQVKAFCAAVARDYPRQHTVVKIIVTRGPGGRGYTPPGDTDCLPSILLQTRPLSLAAEEGVSLHICARALVDNPLLAGIKHLNRLDYVMAAAQQPEAAGWLLMHNTRGEVVETLHHNIFFVRANQLQTPPIRVAGVAGVMRRFIMEELAVEIGMSVAEVDWPLDKLAIADEIFICNAVTGVVPVTAIGDRRWSVGPVTKALGQCLRRAWPYDLGDKI